MSASSSYSAPPSAVVSPFFCSPNSVGLIFVARAPTSLEPGHVAVTDINGDLIFKVEDRTDRLPHSRKIFFDASGNPVISAQQEQRSRGDPWQVFMGDGSDSKRDLLFTVKMSTREIQDVAEQLEVFLAANTEEEVADFKVSGRLSEKTLTMYKESASSTVVAHMKEEYRAARSSASEQAFGVTVSPNMDRAFVTAIVIILLHLDGYGDQRVLPAVAVAVVSPRFCALDRTDLVFFLEPSWRKIATLAITCTSGDVIFTAESRSSWHKNRQVVLDGSGNLVVFMTEKILSLHNRWKVFAGGSSSDPEGELLFSAKSRFATGELDVFLAANAEEEIADFKVKGSYSDRTCTVYDGDGSTVVAQMSRELSYDQESPRPPGPAFGVRVYPGTDCSFVTALIVILHQLHGHEGNAAEELPAQGDAQHGADPAGIKQIGEMISVAVDIAGLFLNN